ncbi:MAG: bifunctional alpha,alpha-trehalose-phosphate synthase (UDP-forming)/trehalose-phosphatase, partial [Deltaproteobacteria bacterium]|nr:bifunctional alpha,alpha-trehalose-phosphate synthase (UDP-forming)/trehalose-phosphatase [Deltaproteobacteria bacterium]
LTYQGRTVRFDAFPMGIDARSFAEQAESDPVLAEVARIRSESSSQRLVLGVDRLDYTKGIVGRLHAIALLLEREPDLRGRLRFIQIAVPSRANVPEYGRLTDEVNRLVGSINGRFGSASSVPVHYLYRSVARSDLVAMYRAADVMLVTPLRDGMNLVAKEFVASRVDEDGVLVLSEFAGAASEMGEAILVNPYDVDQMAAQISQALLMPAEERRERMRALRRRVFDYDAHRWAETFIDELERTREFAPAPTLRLSSRRELAELEQRLRSAGSMVLFLDYDGTLVPFARLPELAWPDHALRDLLTQLGRSERIDVHVVSGRQRELLERWFGDLPIGLHAEHGLWSRLPGGIWSQPLAVDNTWMERVRALLRQFAMRVPGSFVEEKTAALAWHFRSADPEFGEWQARELQTHLTHALSNVPVEILLGDKVVEVQPHGINKGLVVRRLSASTANAVAVALGDDQTDENLFAALPESGIGIHVGPRPSRAQYRLSDVAAARALLWRLVAPEVEAYTAGSADKRVTLFGSPE